MIPPIIITTFKLHIEYVDNGFLVVAMETCGSFLIVPPDALVTELTRAVNSHDIFQPLFKFKFKIMYKFINNMYVSICS